VSRSVRSADLLPIAEAHTVHLEARPQKRRARLCTAESDRLPKLHCWRWTKTHANKFRAGIHIGWRVLATR